MLQTLQTIVQTIKNALGDSKTIAVKKTTPLVKKINALEKSMQALSSQELFDLTETFRARHKKGESLQDLLPEAFAAVREVSQRETGLRHYDVQLSGGILLFWNYIAEMKTGEGKTLVATLPTYLNAIAGQGVHVVTVNDYLARRDAVWVGQIYAQLGMTIGVINSQNESFIYDTSARAEHDEERDSVGSFKIIYDFLTPCTRKEAYQCDIVYGTNSEYGFDYLRDNLEFDADNIRQRKLSYAIVDEIDSILIDEARTPLIISAPATEGENLYTMFHSITRSMVRDKHYTVDEKFKQIALTDAGIEIAEQALGVSNIYTDKGVKYVHHLETAVRAEALFHREREYVVRDGQIVIVDESTGRLQPGRRWSEGLHQAIEAKERLQINAETKTVASVTYQNYFRMYENLCGMTGTAQTSSEEFFKVYGLEVAVVPTHVPVKRIDDNDLIFQTEQGKLQCIAKKVRELNKTGQPVLIGTVTIEKSEELSQFLQKEKIPHTILNAKNHEREGEIVADAGKRGAVTVATNMAGRGVDIKLGGSQATEQEYKEIVDLGGLFVIGTERHDARRIDNQLRGRSGRQGDPGQTHFYVSMEDNMMRIFASDVVKGMMGKMGLAPDEPIQHKMISRSLEKAQTRIEGMNFDSRKHVLRYDDVLNTQRSGVYGRRRTILTGTDAEVHELLDTIIEEHPDMAQQQADKEQAVGAAQYIDIFRKVYLESINTYWMEHLDTMDMLRSSVSLQAYGQKDPLIEYKRQGLMFFKQMLVDIDTQALDTMSRLDANAVAQLEQRNQQQEIEAQKIMAQTNTADGTTVPATKSEAQKIGRNDSCSCGSGKKYKRCCGV